MAVNQLIQHQKERKKNATTNQRVDEKTQLDAKAKALSDFIGNSDIFPTLDAAEQERLKRAE